MATELCPGIIFPGPYPQGYGDTPLLPRPCRPNRAFQGACPRPPRMAMPLGVYSRLGGPARPGAGTAPAAGVRGPGPGRDPPLGRPPGTGCRSDRNGSFLVGTAVTPQPRGSFRARTPVHPVRPRSAPLVRVGERRGPLGRVQLPSRPRRPRRLRNVRRRGRRGRPRPRRRHRGLPDPSAALRAQRGPGARREPGADLLAARPGGRGGAPGRPSRRRLCDRRLTRSHAHTRMISANFTSVAPPWGNGLPTPLPPGKKGPFAALAPYGDGPCA